MSKIAIFGYPSCF